MATSAQQTPFPSIVTRTAPARHQDTALSTGVKTNLSLLASHCCVDGRAAARVGNQARARLLGCKRVRHHRLPDHSRRNKLPQPSTQVPCTCAQWLAVQ